MKVSMVDRALFSSSRYDEHKVYWKDVFSHIEKPFSLPKTTIYSARDSKVSRAETSREFDAINTAKLKEAAASDPFSLYVIIIAALQFQLSKYSGDEKSIIATPVYKSEDDYSFENKLFLLLNAAAGNSLRELIGLSKLNVELSHLYQDFPLSELNTPDFFIDEVTNVSCYFPEIHQSPGENISDLHFEIQQSTKTIQLLASFDERLYDVSFIDGIIEKVELTLSFLDRVDTPSHSLPYLTRHELDVITRMDKIDSNAKSYKNIVQVFEEQVAAHPTTPAIIFNDVVTSYEQLDRKVRHLASFLQSEFEITRGDRVGVMLNRSDRLIVCLLAVLRIGATYVPLDRTHPIARRDNILKEVNARALIIDSIDMNNVGTFDGNVFVADLQIESISDYVLDVDVLYDASDIAYIIYTSGSTGEPKGVMAPHAGMLNTLLWRRDYYSFTTSDTSLQVFAATFDGSITDIYTILISGGCLVVPAEDRKNDVAYLVDQIRTHRVTNFIAVPSLYRVLQPALTDVDCSSLRVVTLAGEAVENNDVDSHYKRLPHIQLYNEYGPTENSVCSTATLLQHGKDVSIGMPIWNVRTAVLDRHNKVVPVGAIGELCLGGAGLAAGYLNRDELFAEKITKIERFEGRFYKTGDYVSMLSDGSLKYIGRIDNQVKIKGYRIELEEIERALKQCVGIKESVCEVLKNLLNENSIAAFIVVSDNSTLNEIRAQLENILPAYMIPEHFVFLKELPLTSNGKTDRILLRNYSLHDSQQDTFVAPVTDTEHKLVEIWKSILGTDEIGVTTNFFYLGGHSLKATQIASRVLKTFNVAINIKSIFDCQNIQALAQYIDVQSVAIANDDRVRP